MSERKIHYGTVRTDCVPVFEATSDQFARAGGYLCQVTAKPCAVVPWADNKPCQCEACQAYWDYQGTEE